MNRELKKKRQYMSPHCWIISMDDEGFICVSGKLDASGSSGGYWEAGGFYNGDHSEWFGSMSEVAPSKGGLWEEDIEE